MGCDQDGEAFGLDVGQMMADATAKHDDAQEALREMVTLMVERGDSPTAIAANLVKLDRVRELVREARLPADG